VHFLQAGLDSTPARNTFACLFLLTVYLLTECNAVIVLEPIIPVFVHANFVNIAV